MSPTEDDAPTGPLPAQPYQREPDPFISKWLTRVFASVIILSVSAIVLALIGKLVMGILGVDGPGSCP